MASADFTIDRIAALKTKLAAREGKPEYKANVAAIKDEIARLETTVSEMEIVRLEGFSRG